jgi:hypothetical protein
MPAIRRIATSENEVKYEIGTLRIAICALTGRRTDHALNFSVHEWGNGYRTLLQIQSAHTLSPTEILPPGMTRLTLESMNADTQCA